MCLWKITIQFLTFCFFVFCQVYSWGSSEYGQVGFHGGITVTVNGVVDIDLLTRDFKQPRRQRQRKRHLKIYVLVNTCTSSRLLQFFNLYNVAELSWNEIGRNRVQVETE